MNEALFPIREKFRHEEEPRRSAGFRLCVVATLLMLYCATMMLQPRGLVLTLITDIINLVLTCLATRVFIDNARRRRGSIRLFWSLLATGWGILSLVQIPLMYHRVVLGQNSPDLPVADAVLFLSNMPVLAALLLRIRPQWWETDKKSCLVDFGLLLAWWLYPYVYFVAPWRVVELNEARYHFCYSRLDGLWNVVLLLLAAYLFKHASTDWRILYGVFIAAELLLGLRGYLVNLPIADRTYYPGSWYDLPSTIALALFAVVGVIGRSRAEDGSNAQNSSPFLLEKWGMAALLSLPVITGTALLIQHSPPRVAQFREVVVQGAILVIGALLFVRQQRMISELTKASRALRHASLTDPLTGCANRRFLEAVLPADASLALRAHTTGANEKAHDLVFYLVDLDDFKEVNDRYGHSLGDHVLLEIVSRIRSVIRKSDVLVRWGGDEFLIVSRNSDRSEAAGLTRRILRTVEAPIEGGSVDSPIIRQTCSIGWAAYPWREDQTDETEIKAMIGLADRAMYQAKALGKNRAVGASASKSGRPRFQEISRHSPPRPRTLS
jgi:diguanylate cyclase (GGDEF)-like protein